MSSSQTFQQTAIPIKGCLALDILIYESMFSEELSGNVNRKRQEQLKARRVELQRNKILQQGHTLAVDDGQKSKNLKETERDPEFTVPTPTVSSSPFEIVSDSSVSTSSTSATASTATLPFTGTAIVTNAKEEKKTLSTMTIMEQVLHSRQVRLQSLEQHMRATKIQAVFRAYKSYIHQKLQIQTCLSERIADLRIVKQSLVISNTCIDEEYAPPPSMVTTLIQQLLFVMHTRPRHTRQVDVDASIHRDKFTSCTQPSMVSTHGPGKSIPDNNTFSSQDIILITGVIQEALLPGIRLASKNHHLDPLGPWIDTIEGRLRLVKLLRLVLLSMTARKNIQQQDHRNPKDNSIHTSGMISGVSPPFLTYPKQIHILMDFLQHVLDIRGEGEKDTPENGHGNYSSKVVGGGGCKNTISNGNNFHRVIEFCSSFLLDPTLDRTSLSINDIGSWSTRSLLKQQQEQQPLIAGHVSKRNHSTNSSHRLVETYHTLDLIRFTRSILLYSSGTYPIPSNIETLREGSISQDDRERYSVLVDLVFRVVTGSSHTSLHIRIVTELWTIPLFTWKVNANTLDLFLQHGKNQMGIPYFIQFIDTVLRTHSTMLFREDRSLLTLLPELDVPLTRCPSPSSISLLSTLAYFGQICQHTNGSKILSTHSVDGTYMPKDTDMLIHTLLFKEDNITQEQFFFVLAACIFFNFLALLVDCIPLGTFTSRQSSVDWLCDGSHLKPVVLNPVILDQCKMLLYDRYVRCLFKCAIFHAALNPAEILMKKDKHDLDMEKETIDILSLSASSLASKDATLPDRSKSLFVSSEWAKKLTRGVVSVPLKLTYFQMPAEIFSCTRIGILIQER